MGVRAWIVVVSLTAVTGCVASFDAGAHAMRDTQGRVGAGISGGGGGGVALPRGALLIAQRYAYGVGTNGEPGGLFHTIRLRWHDSPGPWSPRAGVGMGFHVAYEADTDTFANAAAFVSIGIARGLYRDCRSFIATTFELTLGRTWGSEHPDENGVLGLLTVSMVFERWPEIRTASTSGEARR